VQGYESAMHNPDDFDGMAIGGAAPPVSNPRLPGIGGLTIIIEQSKGLGPEKLQMVSRAATAACDKLDGVKDGVISYPKQCGFDPDTLLCHGSSGENCLTALEAAAIKQGYSLGMSPGTEYYWRFLENLGAIFPAEAYKYLAFPAPPNETLLQSFSAKQHKMISYIGTVDVSAPGFEKYQEALVASYLHAGSSVKEAKDHVGRFYRAFELPGMEHCTGGPGPNNISASLQPERSHVGPNEDIMVALTDWVERGKAPEFLVATKYLDDDPAKAAVMTRPICVYPKLAQWNRKGDPSSRQSFACVDPPAH
jgi:feruloyl esterase